MRRGSSPLVSGIVLVLVGIYLAVYFSFKNMWNVGTVIAMLMIAVLAAFQFFIYFKFFRDDKRNLIDKSKTQQKSQKAVNKKAD